MAFGFWEAILAHLTRQLGLKTDDADPAGSLHAKVKNINNDVDYIIAYGNAIRCANASDTQRFLDETYYYNEETSPTLINRVWVSRPGIIRVSFELAVYKEDSSHTAYGRITVNNGVNDGLVLRDFSNSSKTFVLCTADVAVPAGAYVEFWLWGSRAYGVRAQNLKISYDPGSIIETQEV